MDYKDITNSFIKEYPDYKSDVRNFSEYLEKYWENSLSGDPLRILLKGIDVEFILKSLVYNVENVKRYKTKDKSETVCNCGRPALQLHSKRDGYCEF